MPKSHAQAGPQESRYLGIPVRNVSRRRVTISSIGKGGSYTLTLWTNRWSPVTEFVFRILCQGIHNSQHGLQSPILLKFQAFLPCVLSLISIETGTPISPNKLCPCETVSWPSHLQTSQPPPSPTSGWCLYAPQSEKKTPQRQVSKLPFCQGTAVPRRRRMRNLDIHWIGKTNLDKMQDIYSSKPIFSKVWSFCVLCLSFPTRKSTKKAEAEWRAKSMRQNILLSTASALKAAHTAQRLDAAPQRCEHICRLPPRGSIAAGVAGGLWTNCRESYKFCTSCKLVRNKQLACSLPKQQEKGVLQCHGNRLPHSVSGPTKPHFLLLRTLHDKAITQ